MADHLWVELYGGWRQDSMADQLRKVWSRPDPRQPEFCVSYESGFGGSVKLLKVAAALLFFALAALPQTAGPGAKAVADPVIRVDVNLRQVDLTVTDAKGNHVTDLQPTDFQLFEDGKPQQITTFSWVEVTPPPSGARLVALKEKPSLLEWYTGVPRLRKTPGNDIATAPAANLRKDEIRRVIAIVAGDGTVPAMSRIRKFVDEQVGPGDMVAIRSVQRRGHSDR